MQKNLNTESLLNLRTAIKYDQIVVIYTDKCNIECDHCCIDCKTSNTNKVDVSKLRSFLNDSKRLEINSVEFCGGEPFLYIDEILPLAKNLNDDGINTAIVTNGFWGKNKDKAELYINNLKVNGIKKLVISYDKYHKDAGSNINDIKTIVSLCNKYKLEVRLKVVVNPSEPVENYELGHKLMLNKLKSISEQILLAPYGRAQSYTFDQYPLESFGGCSTLGILAIMPNGDIRPCCGGPIADIYSICDGKWLRIGNIFGDTLEEVIRNANNNMFYILLAIGNPVIFKLLSQDYSVDIEFPKELPHLCKFCVWAASLSDKFEELMLKLESDRENVIRRLYYYQEVISRWGLPSNNSAKIKTIKATSTGTQKLKKIG